MTTVSLRLGLGFGLGLGLIAYPPIPNPNLQAALRLHAGHADRRVSRALLD